jgi:hypothetical protein
MSMTIDTAGFRADVVVSDDRDLNEVMDAVTFAAKLPSGAQLAAQPSAAPVSTDHDHNEQRAALAQLFGNLCDHLLDDAGKLLADERARRESLS